MNKKKLCDRLQEAMNLRGLRAVDMVERTGIPKGTISYYMSGKTEPKADRIFLIAKALDVNEAWLMGYDVPMARSTEAKRNDRLAQLVVRMRTDESFYKIVDVIDGLSESKYKSIEQLVAALKE